MKRIGRTLRKVRSRPAMGRVASEHGQSLIELAIALPLLLLLASGITEFGRAYYQYNTLSKAIRNGARYRSSCAYSDANRDNCKNLVACGRSDGSGSPVLPGLTAGMIQVTASGGTGSYNEGNPPKWVTVKVNNYPFNSLIPGFIKLNVNFSPEVQMRYVGPNAN
jgi:Flp pilus assembly protein TadG